MTDEKEQKEEIKGMLMMMFFLVLAFILNPFVKLKDWIKHEHE